MAKPKGGLIYSLAKVPLLLKANSDLKKRVARLEKILLGATASVKKARRPKRRRVRGRKRGKKLVAKRLCTVPGCKQKHYAKGLCASHYQKAFREKKAKAK